jgi:hypothetical protein
MISVAPDHNRKTPDSRGRVKPLVIAATILVAIAALYWTQALLIPFALVVLLTLKRQVLMRKKSTRFLSYPSTRLSWGPIRRTSDWVASFRDAGFECLR